MNGGYEVYLPPPTAYATCAPDGAFVQPPAPAPVPLTQLSLEEKLAVLERLLEADSRGKYRQLAEAMGFAFGPMRARRYGAGAVKILCAFVCVCGRREQAELTLYGVEVGMVLKGELKVDFVEKLATELGSFGRSHLRGDGYDEDQIASLVAKVPPHLLPMYEALPGH